MFMKKILSLIITASLLSSAVLSGCDFIVNDSNTKETSSPITQDDESDDGEVEFHFSGNNDDDTPTKDHSLPKMIEPTTCPLSDSAIEYVTTNADSIIAQYPDFSGTVLMSSGNRIVYEKSFGTTDGKTPNEDNTIYQIGSVTKQFTGTAILQLEKQGLLDVTDTLDKYFPEYTDAGYLRNITVSQLLQMTAGFGDYMLTIEGDEELHNEFVKISKESEDEAKKFIVSTIFKDGIYTDPGTVYKYSNSSYYLLGIIIEQLSGMSYRDYLQKNFFDYADMKDTYFVGDGKDLSKGYSPAQVKYISDNDDKYRKAEGSYVYLFSAGSVVSTAEDVLRWMRVVSSSEEMYNATDRKIVEHSTWLYNYGWNTGDYIWHHSGRTYAYSSQVYADYKTDTQLVILTNVSFYEDLGEISYKIYYPLVDEVKKAKK